MSKLLKAFVISVEKLNKLIGWIIALLFGIVCIVTFLQVLARPVGKSLTWSGELSIFLIIWIIVLGAAIALKKGELIAVAVIPDILKTQASKKWLKIIVNLISLPLYITLIKYGFDLAVFTTIQTAPSLGISMFWAYLSIPIGGILFTINSLSLIMEQLIHNKVGAVE